MEAPSSSAAAKKKKKRNRNAVPQTRTSNNINTSTPASDAIPMYKDDIAAQHMLFFSAPIDDEILAAGSSSRGGSGGSGGRRRSRGGGAVASLNELYNRMRSTPNQSTKGGGQGRFDEARLDRIREGLVRIFELQHQRELEQRQQRMQERYKGLKDLLTVSLFQRQRLGMDTGGGERSQTIASADSADCDRASNSNVANANRGAGIKLPNIFKGMS